MGLLSIIKDTVKTGADASASLVARKMIEKRFSRYGTIRQLNLDSRTKQLRVEVMLAGEAEPITITVDRYEIVKTTDGTAVVVRAASASREWLNQVIADLVIDRSFAIPAKYESIISVFM
jgi:predicted oxidoreductase